MALSPDAVRMMGVDSNCLSFIIDAFEGIERPTDDLAEQKIALAWIFFYTGQTFFTTPIVKGECDRISDPGRRAKHQSWMLTPFGTLPVRVHPDDITRRAKYFQQFHGKERDCRILAEAEATRLAILLSFDFDFVDRLAGQSNVMLMKPLDCWRLFDIPKGSPPKTVPHPTNPLVAHDWWRW